MSIEYRKEMIIKQNRYTEYGSYEEINSISERYTCACTINNWKRSALALTCFSPSCKWFTSCDMWHLSE